MRKRRSDHKPTPTLADGYQSIRALTLSKTQEEIAAIVADEWIERERTRIEQDAKVEHVARTLAKRRDRD